MYQVILAVLVLLLGIAAGYLIRYFYGKTKLASSEALAKKVVADAQAQAEVKKKEALLEAKETLVRERKEIENEFRDQRQRLSSQERRLNQRDESLDRKVDIIEKKERDIHDKERSISHKEKELIDATTQVHKTREEQRLVLERIAGMSAEEAKKILLQSYEDEIRKEAMIKAKNIEQEARDNADRRAKEIVAATIQRVAAEHTVDMTVSTVPITNDELKGRVIGREGRNIRAFEQATGVDLIVDDTPESLTISAFDPVRREIARISLERLITDGRIHPTRIEEVVNKVKDEMQVILKDVGEKAALEVGVVGLPVEILKLLGKLKFRSSYGQNQLQHTMEVAWLSSVMASELGADVNMCKKAALMHDIGKAVDQDVEGTHHQLSADIARKHGESEKMINIIISHHEGIQEPKSVEAFIIAACDAISAARPGARRESAEHYIKRLEKLEKVATSFKGVEHAYAIQAGREVRVMVEPDEVNDQAAYVMAKDIAKKVEQELEYPGQVKIVVVREIRAQEIAK